MLEHLGHAELAVLGMSHLGSFEQRTRRDIRRAVLMTESAASVQPTTGELSALFEHVRSLSAARCPKAGSEFKR